MLVSIVCKKYFSGFQEVSHYKNNSKAQNLLAILKILSYLIPPIPLGFAVLYGSDYLYERVIKKKTPSFRDRVIQDQTHRILNIKTEIAFRSNIGFKDVLSVYHPNFVPKANQINLNSYYQSLDYQRHCQTARIYYNAQQLSQKDALQVIFQREPTNICMGSQQYQEAKLKALFGYCKSVYNDQQAKKSDGSLFKDLPNTAAVYSETYLWNPPGGQAKKEIACLSLPAPALDSDKQPHYTYYIKAGQLDVQKYEQEIAFLFKIIEQTIRDNQTTAFENKGIRRVVLSKFGQGAFLGAVSQADQKIANHLYRKQMALFLNNIEDTGLRVVMSEYVNPSQQQVWLNDMIIGDIVQTAEEGDLIINAWDPHSAPGNGNDADKSFDGAMGKSSGILVTQTSWLNQTLTNNDALISVSL